MRKHYFVAWGDFANTYTLRWAYQAELSGYERITQKQAYNLARRERRARKTDPAFSGYADTWIYPADYDPDEDWYRELRKIGTYELGKGRIEW